MVLFRLKPRRDYSFDIKCEEKPIPVSSEIQLLDVTLDNKLKFDSHIASICRKVGGQVNALRSFPCFAVHNSTVHNG